MEDDEEFRRLVNEAMPEEIANYIGSRVRPIYNEILSQRPEIARLLTENIRARYVESKSYVKGSTKRSSSNNEDKSSESSSPSAEEEIPSGEKIIPYPTFEEFHVSATEQSSNIGNTPVFETVSTQQFGKGNEMHDSCGSYEDGWSAGHEEGYLEGQKDGYKKGFAAAKKAAGICRERNSQLHMHSLGHEFSRGSMDLAPSTRYSTGPEFDVGSTSKSNQTMSPKNPMTSSNSHMSPSLMTSSAPKQASNAKESPNLEHSRTTFSFDCLDTGEETEDWFNESNFQSFLQGS